MAHGRVKRSVVDDRQLDLFSSAPALVHQEAAPIVPAKPSTPTPPPGKPIQSRKSPERPERKARAPKPKRMHDYVVDANDIPPFPPEAEAFAAEALASAPSGKALFTYADIALYFGISRATVIRRQRSGIIPGVRFIGSRVLEEGHVRRLTREQVRYLLMVSRT